MNKRTLLLVFCLFIAIGLPRLFSLEAHWSSDERTWLRRSAIFITAVQTGQFEQTLQAYHPGVTTMWLSGLRTFFENPSLNIRNLALARWFICFVISTGLIATFFLLHPLFGTWPATAAFSFLAINPFFLTQTRRVHTDALATTFILLTVLLFLIYCQNRNRHRYLIFSGITYGIALLSKSYALILLPWLPVCLFLFRDKEKRCFLTHIAEGGCFLSCTSLTVLALWPVFWTPNFALMALYLFWITVVLFREMKAERSPMWLVCALLAGVCLVGVVATQNVWPVFDGVNWAVTTPHEVEHFFLGKIVNDPGWFYYPIVLSIKSTPFVLPLAIFAILFLWKRRKRTVFPRIFKNVIAIGLVVILFTICLSLTSKKLPRYLLPAFAMFDILAGIGLFYTVKWIRARLKQKTIRNVAQVSCIGLILLLTAFPVFALHPYYGSYYNLCWKIMDITKIITLGEGSGLDLAAKYLNKKPNAAKMTVQVSAIGTQLFYSYFYGNVYQFLPEHIKDTEAPPPVDYEVVYIRDSQIKWVHQEGTRGGTLEKTITLNGIDHVWIYRIPHNETP